jgi:hypothetical protein
MRGSFMKEVNPIPIYKQTLTSFIREVESIGAVVLLADAAAYEPGEPDPESRAVMIRTAMKQVAEETSTPFLPVHDMLRQHFDLDTIFFEHDRLHINEKGNQEGAKLLYDFLLREYLLAIPKRDSK